MINNIFQNKYCCFYGELQYIDSKGAKNLIESLGGICEKRITDNTNLLVITDSEIDCLKKEYVSDFSLPSLYKSINQENSHIKILQEAEFTEKVLDCYDTKYVYKREDIPYPVINISIDINCSTYKFEYNKTNIYLDDYSKDCPGLVIIRETHPPKLGFQVIRSTLELDCIVNTTPDKTAIYSLEKV